MLNKLCVLVAFLASSFVGTAWGAENTLGESLVSQALSMVIQTLGAALGVLLLILVKRAITFFEQKTKIDISTKMEETLLLIAQHSVDYASEKAHQLLKEKNQVMPSIGKLGVALEFGMRVVQEQGLQDIAKEKLIRYIEAKLGATR